MKPLFFPAAAEERKQQVPYLNQLETIDVTIANGASLSGAATLDGKSVVGLISPAAWTPAGISFEASRDGTTFYPLYSAAGEVSIPSAHVAAAEARFFQMDPGDWIGFAAVKVRSGLNGAAVAQGAARTVTLVVRPV